MGVKRQAISARLKNAGVEVKGRDARKRLIEREALVSLRDRRFAICRIAEQLRATPGIVRRELERLGLDAETKYRRKCRYADFDELNVGGSTVEEHNYLSQYPPLRKAAKRRNLKVSLRRINPTTVRVTRIE